ncbi:MAG: radical SAM protein, partial [Bauldia sp.]|nr:radical SAM protein [Bauldia sp.]
MSSPRHRFAASRIAPAQTVEDFVGVQIDPERRRGRGAGINPSGRYEAESRFRFDDGWGSADELPPLRTEVQEERPRKIITTNQSPDISFDRSI